VTLELSSDRFPMHADQMTSGGLVGDAARHEVMRCRLSTTGTIAGA